MRLALVEGSAWSDRQSAGLGSATITPARDTEDRTGLSASLGSHRWLRASLIRVSGSAKVFHQVGEALNLPVQLAHLLVDFLDLHRRRNLSARAARSQAAQRETCVVGHAPGSLALGRLP